MRPDYILDDRKEAADELSKKLGRPPTRRELAEAWGIPLSTANTYIGAAKRMYDYSFNLTNVRDLRDVKVRESIEDVVEMIEEKYKIKPSGTELAHYYGVSRQRIQQVTSDLDIELRDGKKPIRWEV